METCERCGLPFATSSSDLSKYDEKCLTRFPTAANADGCRWAREKRKKLLAESMMVSALADARAAGYAEAIEKAVAEVADQRGGVLAYLSKESREMAAAALDGAIARIHALAKNAKTETLECVRCRFTTATDPCHRCGQKSR